MCVLRDGFICTILFSVKIGASFVHAVELRALLCGVEGECPEKELLLPRNELLASSFSRLVSSLSLSHLEVRTPEFFVFPFVSVEVEVASRSGRNNFIFLV